MKTKLKPSCFQSLAQKNREKGFTLLELLVVIVITGVLPAIAIPLILNHYDLRASDLWKHYFQKTNPSHLSQD